MKATIKENKVDDMFNDIQTGTGWASYDYILNSKHSPLSKQERVRLLIKLAKAGILADEDKLSGKEEHKNQIPSNAFMSLQDLDRKYKSRTNPTNETISMNESKYKSNQVQYVVNNVKKQLINKWKTKGAYENFGDKEERMLKNKFDYNPYGDNEERKIAAIIDNFGEWSMNYTDQNESVNESINIVDYEPVHGSYGFDKLQKLSDTNHAIKLSKNEFNGILKLLKRTGTDIVKKIDTEEYYTIYSLGNDYNLVRLKMKNEGLNEDVGSQRYQTPKGFKNINKYTDLLGADEIKINVGSIKSPKYVKADVWQKQSSSVILSYSGNKTKKVDNGSLSNIFIKESINEDVKDDLMNGGMKTWWKYDKKDVMSFIYWLQRQIPPTGPKFDTEWKKIAAQLQKKHPAPKDTYDKIVNESVNESRKFGNWTVTREDENQIKLVNQDTMDELYVHKSNGKFEVSYKNRRIIKPSLKQVMDNVLKLGESINEETWSAKDSRVWKGNKPVMSYEFDRDSNAFWVNPKTQKGQKSFDEKNQLIQWVKKNPKEWEWQAENVNEEDATDTVNMDVPLFIRSLEYAKEDAKTDMDLHDFAEKAIRLTKEKGTISMDSYNMLVGSESKNEGVFDKLLNKSRQPSDEEYNIATKFVKKEFGSNASVGSIGVESRTGNINVEVNKGPKSEDIRVVLSKTGKLLKTYKINWESVTEAKFGYKDSTSSYITDHNDEYKLAQSIMKKVGGNEIKFYDELENVHDKLGHPKYMKWLSNALRGYKVDMYKDPKIKNKAEAEEALYILSK